MALTYYKAITDDGGAIGTQIYSGVVDTILPEITPTDMDGGATISRKFYIANSEASDVTVSNLSLTAYSVFPTILFESTGDAQVVGDLVGSETDESPIVVIIPANSHKSFWLQVNVPIASTTTSNFNSVDVKQVL